MQYTETELSDLIKSVEAEFSAHLSLAKSEDFSEKKEEPKDEPKDEKENDEKKDESHDEGHEEKSDEGEEEHKEESEEPNKEFGEKDEAEGEHKPESDEGHDYDEDDMNQMHSMYSSMGKGELKAHHDAIKKCLDSHKEGAMMAKSETISIEVPEVKNEEVALLKSEVEAEKAKAEKLQKSLDAVTTILTKMVAKTVPAAKAVTELQVINKSEMTGSDKQLSKSEITAKLMAAASRPDLAKSDKEAINAFYLGNNPNIESISHLLK